MGCPASKNSKIFPCKKHKYMNNIINAHCAKKNVLHLKQWLTAKLMEKYSCGESEVFSQFFSSHPTYLQRVEKLKDFHENLHLFWENMELLKRDLHVKTRDEVFLSHNSQSSLIFLCTERPWVTDTYELIEDHFDESDHTDLQQIINKLFELWDKDEKSKRCIQSKEEEKIDIEDKMEE